MEIQYLTHENEDKRPKRRSLRGAACFFGQAPTELDPALTHENENKRPKRRSARAATCSLWPIRSEPAEPSAQCFTLKLHTSRLPCMLGCRLASAPTLQLFERHVSSWQHHDQSAMATTERTSKNEQTPNPGCFCAKMQVSEEHPSATGCLFNVGEYVLVEKTWVEFKAGVREHFGLEQAASAPEYGAHGYRGEQGFGFMCVWDLEKVWLQEAYKIIL